MKVHIAINEDIFGGYGLIAVGTTKDNAIAALYKKYRAISAKWNDGEGINCKNLSVFMDEWGCTVHALDPKDKDNQADMLCG